MEKQNSKSEGQDQNNLFEEIKKRVPLSTWVSGAIAVVLALCLGFMCFSYQSGAAQQRSFSTPEEAMQYFTLQIANTDYSEALQAFDYSDRAEGYKFTDYLNSMGTWMPYQMPAPEFDSFESINRETLASQAAGQIKMFSYSFSPVVQEWGTDGKSVLEESIVALDDSHKADKLKDLLNPQNLKNLKLVRTDLVKPDTQTSEQYVENVKNAGAYYGYTDMKEYFALYELDGKYFVGSFTLTQCGDKWKIASLSSLLGNTSSYGLVENITEKNYEMLVE